MQWLLYALIPPALWAMMNYFDKYLLNKYYQHKSVGVLIIYSGMIGFPAAFVIALFNQTQLFIPFESILITCLSGAIYLCSMIAYLQALGKDDASSVAPLFQLSAIISLVFGFFVFGEILNIDQILGGLMILVGSLGLSMGMMGLDNKLYFKKEIFLLMLLASFLASVNGVLFKFVALEASFWVSIFWMYIGYSIYTVFILIVAPKVRKEFIEDLSKNSINVISINMLNEFLTAIGNISFNFALILAPIGLVYFVGEGLQPFFVLLYGVILTIFFPKIANEDISGNHIVQKVLAICLMAAGMYLIGV